MIMCAPMSLARSSPSLRALRMSASKPLMPSSPRRRGGTLISMLNWPSSVWKAGSAMASSASAFFIAGSPFSSTRLNSISSPVIGRSDSKRDSRNIRANTSRHRRTLAR